MPNKKDYSVMTNPMTWGQVAGCVFFYDYRSKSNGLYPVKIRLTYKRERTYYNTGYAMTVDDWKNYNSGRGQIADTRRGVQQQMEIIAEHIKDINRTNEFSFDLLAKRMSRGSQDDVFSAFNSRITELRRAGQVGNASVYECALNSLRGYAGNGRLKFKKITVKWLKDYEAAMTKEKKSVTTRSMYLRCLRAIINDSGMVSPFGKDKFQVKSGDGRKMALTKPQIKELMTRPVVPGGTTEKMRDLFYFSYLTNGMNIRDLVLLKWDNIADGVISFVRAKTARTGSKVRTIQAPLLPATQRIIDKWANKDSEYVFDYVNDRMTPDEVMLTTKNLTRLMNKHLNIITEAIGLPQISTYTARHSYATNLMRAKVPVEFISGQMGHRDISTTQKYLEGFELEDMVKYNKSLSDEE